MKRKKFLSFLLCISMLVSTFIGMPLDRVYATNELDAYTNVIFEDDFSDAAVSAKKWSNTLNVRDGVQVFDRLNTHYNMSNVQVGNALYEMDWTVDGADWIGLLFNRNNAADTWDNSGCMVYLRNTGKIDVLGMTVEESNQDVLTYANGTKVTLQVLSENGTITVYANDDLVLKATTNNTHGYAGVWCAGNQGSGKMDNVKVKTLPPVQDDNETILATFQTIKDGLSQSVIYIDAKKISDLPSVSREGYAYQIIKSSDEEVVALDGTVTPPAEAKTVTVTYKLSYTFDDIVTSSEEYSVEYSIKKATSQSDISHFLDKKYGLFVHYVWIGQEMYQTGVSGLGVGAIYPDGSKVQSIDDMINRFDAAQLAADCAEFGVQYLILTSHHYDMNSLYPSEVYDKYRYHKEDNPDSADLIEKVYQELKKYDIDLYLYIHPHDIHDFCEHDKESFGYVNTLNHDIKKWQDYVDETYRELMERYQGKIKGIFLDEAFGNPAESESVNDYERIRDSIKSYDSSVVMIQNYYGSCYTLDTGMLENGLVWHGANHSDVDTWATTNYSSGTVIRNNAGSWWACHSVTDTKTTAIASAKDLFRYTILQAAQNTEGGGVAFAMGPYCGSWTDSKGQNNIWEPGIRDTMVELGSYIKPIQESVFNTRPSTAFVTTGGTRYGAVTWGVATQSSDGAKTYVHIMKPPVDSNSINIGTTDDGTLFTSAKLLTTGEEVGFLQDDKGVTLILPDNAKWNELDTVIVLTTDSKASLEGTVRKANKVLDNNAPWMYSELAEKTLKNAIKQAQEVVQKDNATEEQIRKSSEDVKNAIDAYLASFKEDSIAGENYAEGKQVTSSSSLEGSGFSKANLTDGNKFGDENRGWTSDPHSITPNKTEWIQVDLGECMEVGRVDLTPIVAEGYGFPRDFYVEISEDGENYTNVYEGSGYVSDGSILQIHFAAAKARYVRVIGTKLSPDQANGTYYRMQFSEIEVYPMSAEEAAYNAETVSEGSVGTKQLVGWLVAGIMVLVGLVVNAKRKKILHQHKEA